MELEMERHLVEIQELKAADPAPIVLAVPAASTPSRPPALTATRTLGKKFVPPVVSRPPEGYPVHHPRAPAEEEDGPFEEKPAENSTQQNPRNGITSLLSAEGPRALTTGIDSPGHLAASWAHICTETCHYSSSRSVCSGGTQTASAAHKAGQARSGGRKS